MDWYKRQQILEPRAHDLLRPITFLNLAINKLILVIWFNLKVRLLRLRHALSCKDSIDLGLIPLPLHPIHVWFHNKCWTKIFDALTPVMLDLLTCLVCRNFFNVLWVLYYFLLGSQSLSSLHLSILDCTWLLQYHYGMVWVVFCIMKCAPTWKNTIK